MIRLYCSSFFLKKKKKNYKIKCRESTIMGTCLHKKYKIYNGKKYISILINKNMLGLKFGSFSFSKAFKKQKVIKKVYVKKKVK